jgi:hypothetical protein
MYALVYKNNIIVGPKSWDKGFFEFALKRKKIEIDSIPIKPTPVLPYVINEDTKIYPVEFVMDNINPLYQYHRGPLWEIKDDIVIASYEIIETDLEAVKNNFKEFLAIERYTKEVSGTKITVQDTEVTIDTSRDGRNIFVQKFMLMTDTDIVNWKFPEKWLQLTKSEFGEVIAAGAAHIQSAFDWEREISEQIDAEISVADLIKYEEIIKPKIELTGHEITFSSEQ